MLRWVRTSEGSLERTMEFEHFSAGQENTMYNKEELGNPSETTEAIFSGPEDTQDQ